MAGGHPRKDAGCPAALYCGRRSTQGSRGGTVTTVHPGGGRLDCGKHV